MTKIFMAANCRDIGEAAQVVPFASVSVESLSALMVDAYQGTVDWEEGDDESAAEAEIRATLTGKYGNFLDNVSGVILDNHANAVSALFASNFEGRATILFVYTSKQATGRGLATRLIRNAAYQLGDMGFEEVSLFVSEENPARALYEKLGFEEK